MDSFLYSHGVLLVAQASLHLEELLALAFDLAAFVLVAFLPAASPLADLVVRPSVLLAWEADRPVLRDSSASDSFASVLDSLPSDLMASFQALYSLFPRALARVEALAEVSQLDRLEEVSRLLL